MNIENYISSGIIEQYVLGLCTAEEKNEMEQLRLTNTLLDKAVINFEVEFEQKMMQGSIMPSKEVDAKILNSLQALSITPVIAMQHDNKNLKTNSAFKLLAAASLMAFGVSAYYNYTQFKKNKEQSLEIASLNKAPKSLPLDNFNILKNPTITPIAMMGQGYHEICRCTMYWDKNTGKAYVMIHHLVPSGKSSEYQLWANVNGKQVSVGMINDDIRDRFVEVTGMPEGAKEFIVTLEKNGGAASPDADIILKGVVV